jgi:hypothetical protein
MSHWRGEGFQASLDSVSLWLCPKDAVHIHGGKDCVQQRIRFVMGFVWVPKPTGTSSCTWNLGDPPTPHTLFLFLRILKGGSRWNLQARVARIPGCSEL